MTERQGFLEPKGNKTPSLLITACLGLERDAVPVESDAILGQRDPILSCWVSHQGTTICCIEMYRPVWALLSLKSTISLTFLSPNCIIASLHKNLKKKS